MTDDELDKELTSILLFGQRVLLTALVLDIGLAVGTLVWLWKN